MNLLVLGPQGSGKGTQAKRISAAHALPHVSTGDMFRAAIASGTELGRRVEPILASGDLVPDELTVALIRERLSEEDARDGFVLDGFPRNLTQAEALDGMLAEIGRGLDAVLFFDLSDELAVERIRGRALDEDRDDDTPEAIATPARDLPRADGAGGRALPRDGEARPAPCGAVDRRGLDGDRGCARPARGRGGGVTARASFSSHCGPGRASGRFRDRCDSGSALADPGSAEDRA